MSAEHVFPIIVSYILLLGSFSLWESCQGHNLWWAPVRTTSTCCFHRLVIGSSVNKFLLVACYSPVEIYRLVGTPLCLYRRQAQYPALPLPWQAVICPHDFDCQHVVINTSDNLRGACLAKIRDFNTFRRVIQYVVTISGNAQQSAIDKLVVRGFNIMIYLV
jgi:hypothetical protein